MKKICFLFCCIFLIASCKKVVISNEPFEINRNITCNDLYDDGYKRIFGIDVILVGKIIPKGQIYYQLKEPTKKSYEEVYTGVNEMVERNDSRESDRYQKYRDINSIELSDSIYELAWEPLKFQQEYLCSDGKVYVRYYQKDIEDINVFKSKIDKLKYKIIQEQFDAYYKDKFKVINLKTKDTFNCFIEEREGKLSFSSQIEIIKYE